MLVLGSVSHDYTPVPPPTQRPPPPAHVPPRLPLLYSTLGPGSAVTYTAERYSYRRMGQKETQVRCPPMPGGTGPLDQGGDACLCDYRCQLAAPAHGRPGAGPGICLSALLPARGLVPVASTCLPDAATSKSPAPPAPATSHQASEQARDWEPRRGQWPHLPCPAREDARGEGRGLPALGLKDRVQGRARPCRTRPRGHPAAASIPGADGPRVP